MNKNIIISKQSFLLVCSLVFVATLFKYQGDPKEKYKVYPEEIIKGINKAREARYNEKK